MDEHVNNIYLDDALTFDYTHILPVTCVVLDPFLGSGTSVLATPKDRTLIGIEKGERQFMDLIVPTVLDTGYHYGIHAHTNVLEVSS